MEDQDQARVSQPPGGEILTGLEGDLGFDRKLLFLLRDTDCRGAPARSEGLDFIASTDFHEFAMASWGELLFVIDFLLRAVVQAEEDPGFVTEWQDHAGMAGHGQDLFFRRVMEVSLVWLERLERIQRYHAEVGREPESDRRIPDEYYLSAAMLDLITDPSRGPESKIGAMRSLTQIVLAHASFASLRASLDSGDFPEGGQDGGEWLAFVASRLLTATSFSPAILLAVGEALRGQLVDVAESVTSSYRRELVNQLHTKSPGIPSDRRVVVIDPQLVLDLAGLECVLALGQYFQTGEEAERVRFERWLEEVRRALRGGHADTFQAPGDDLRELDDWFRPSEGATRPSSIPEVERIARSLLTNLLARRTLKECPELTAPPGTILRFNTRREVILLRIPRDTISPFHVGGAAAVRRAAFSRMPFLTWLLYPTSEADADEPFWAEGLHGAFLRSMSEVSAGLAEESGPTTVRDQLSSILTGGDDPNLVSGFTLRDFPPEAARAGLEMASDVLARWLNWSTSESTS